jgi:hypothetical protein
MSPVLCPPFTRVAVFTLPAELDALALDGTRDEGTPDRHASFTLAAGTAALANGVVVWTQAAREPADSDFGVANLHDLLISRNSGPTILSISNATATCRQHG